jgi:hypothetical protein
MRSHCGMTSILRRIGRQTSDDATSASSSAFGHASVGTADGDPSAAFMEQWTLLVARFNEKGMVPVMDGSGHRLLTDRADLREAIVAGRVVFSESGQRMTSADVDAGRLL